MTADNPMLKRTPNKARPNRPRPARPATPTKASEPTTPTTTPTVDEQPKTEEKVLKLNLNIE